MKHLMKLQGNLATGTEEVNAISQKERAIRDIKAIDDCNNLHPKQVKYTANN